MRLLFAARAINAMAGGVERMIITIMNGLIERGHEIDLLTWDQAGATAFYPMAPQITWHRLNLGDPSIKASPRLILKRAAKTRTLVANRQPEAIVAFQDGPFRALRAYTAGLDIPVIAAERSAPTGFDHTRNGRRRKSIVFNSFRFAASVVIQCESYRAHYPAWLHERIVTIPNPVRPAGRFAQPAKPDASGRFVLLSVGRLSFQKNYECLINAFALVSARFPDWDLMILGEGESREKLERMIEQTPEPHRIRLPGPVSDPERYYPEAHIFCLPSRWEGFPNALAEALAHGLPAIGFADCSGVNELINHGINGFLVPGNGDTHGLAHALSRLMGDETLRTNMGSAACAISDKYRADAILDLWEKTIFRSRQRNEIACHQGIVAPRRWG